MLVKRNGFWEKFWSYVLWPWESGPRFGRIEAVWVGQDCHTYSKVSFFK